MGTLHSNDWQFCYAMNKSSMFVYELKAGTLIQQPERSHCHVLFTTKEPTHCGHVPRPTRLHLLNSYTWLQ